MKPKNLNTKIFLDSGDAEETKEALALLGFLDGQTTNPSLIAKSPQADKRIKEGGKFAKEEVYEYYKNVVQEISFFIPAGSVSVEVYADKNTGADEMLAQACEMFGWIPNAWIKFPVTAAGLEAAGKAVKEGLRVNMTLCFSQEQAAAVYSATAGAGKGSVFISPFIGRLDDAGLNGVDLVKNILKMYEQGDGHVEVLAASLRSTEHLMAVVHSHCDIITAPLRVLKAWSDASLNMPGQDFIYDSRNFQAMPYNDMDIGQDWRTFNIMHELTGKGMEKFADDWNSLIN